MKRDQREYRLISNAQEKIDTLKRLSEDYREMFSIKTTAENTAFFNTIADQIDELGNLIESINLYCKMNDDIDRLLDEFDSGRINSVELLKTIRIVEAEMN